MAEDTGLTKAERMHALMNGPDGDIPPSPRLSPEPKLTLPLGSGEQVVSTCIHRGKLVVATNKGAIFMVDVEIPQAPERVQTLTDEVVAEMAKETMAALLPGPSLSHAVGRRLADYEASWPVGKSVVDAVLDPDDPKYPASATLEGASKTGLAWQCPRCHRHDDPNVHTCERPG